MCLYFRCICLKVHSFRSYYLLVNTIPSCGVTFWKEEVTLFAFVCLASQLSFHQSWRCISSPPHTHTHTHSISEVDLRWCWVSAPPATPCQIKCHTISWGINHSRAHTHIYTHTHTDTIRPRLRKKKRGKVTIRSLIFRKHRCKHALGPSLPLQVSRIVFS